MRRRSSCGARSSGNRGFPPVAERPMAALRCRVRGPFVRLPAILLIVQGNGSLPPPCAIQKSAGGGPFLVSSPRRSIPRTPSSTLNPPHVAARVTAAIVVGRPTRTMGGGGGLDATRRRAPAIESAHSRSSEVLREGRPECALPRSDPVSSWRPPRAAIRKVRPPRGTVDSDGDDSDGLPDYLNRDNLRRR
jgi:hypothetical protein